VVHAEDKQLAVIIFSATILTESGAEWIHRKIEEPEVGKSSKYVRVTADVLISASNEFVRVSAPRRRALKIVYRAGKIGSWEVRIPHRLSGVAEFRLGNHVVQVRLSLHGSCVDAVWVVKLIGDVPRTVPIQTDASRVEALGAERSEIPLTHTCRRNGRNERRACALAVLLPTDVEECFVFDHWSAELEPVLVLRPRWRFVGFAVQNL
jgi:hypothetical protein